MDLPQRHAWMTRRHGPGRLPLHYLRRGRPASDPGGRPNVEARQPQAAPWRTSLHDQATPLPGTNRVCDVRADDIMTIILPIWTGKPESARLVRSRISATLRPLPNQRDERQALPQGSPHTGWLFVSNPCVVPVRTSYRFHAPVARIQIDRLARLLHSEIPPNPNTDGPAGTCTVKARALAHQVGIH